MATTGNSVARRRGPAPPAGACSGCKEAPADGDPLRRGRCRRCYEAWVRQKPVGLGAACAACHERRRACLRQFELHRMWVVLCHNCAARAETFSPIPRSVEGLQLRLARERRWGDRRAAAVGGGRPRPGSERRRDERRVSDRGELLDASDLVIEIEAEFEDPEAMALAELADHDGPITDIHRLADSTELGDV